MQDLPRSERGRFLPGCLVLLILAAAAGYCSLSRVGREDHNSRPGIAISESALKARIAALAQCPSQLDRLGIAHPAIRVVTSTPGEAELIVPSAEGAGSRVRFELEVGKGEDAGLIDLAWQIEFAGNASELDMGEERLLAPVKLERDLGEALESYFDYYYDVGQADSRSMPPPSKTGLDAACRKFGRAADGIAVVTNPELRGVVERQKRRDALGWLFNENYRLRTDSDSDAYWENYGDEP